MRILHLEDDHNDALLVQMTLAREGLAANITHIDSAAGFCSAIDSGAYDAVIVDNGVPGFNAQAALEYSQQHRADLPVIVCSGAAGPEDVAARLREGATEYVTKDSLRQLAATLRRIDQGVRRPKITDDGEHRWLAMQRLIEAGQELSVAHNLDAIKKIACRAARELTHADGASFVLREGAQCVYVEEDAIGPLWKGQYFPMSRCASGWAMLHRQCITIRDVYADLRVSSDPYRSTFVRGVAIVPLRPNDPAGAIGSYWAHPHTPTLDELNCLEALAGFAAAAMENVRRQSEYKRRLAQRTAEMQTAQRELQGIYTVVSQELRPLLRGISTRLRTLRERSEAPEARQSADAAQRQAETMTTAVEQLLKLARLSRTPLHFEHINLSQLVTEAIVRLRAHAPERQVQARIEQAAYARGDRELLATAIENLIANAWKFTQKRPTALLEFGLKHQDALASTYYLKDNGAGFDMQFAEKLFQPFQRLHSEPEFSGAGIGLATASRIIERHGGRIWAEAATDHGATFYFTLPSQSPPGRLG